MSDDEWDQIEKARKKLSQIFSPEIVEAIDALIDARIQWNIHSHIQDYDHYSPPET